MIWKDIIEYEGRYQISNNGDVKSLQNKTEKLLKQAINTSGYPSVSLWKNNKGLTKSVHRLVAIHFLNNDLNYDQVNHIDGNKLNNTVLNLEWCNAKQNIIHSFNNKLNSSEYGIKARSFKGSIYVLDCDDKVVNILNGTKEIINKGFNPTSVTACINNKQKTHKGFKFKRIKHHEE